MYKSESIFPRQLPDGGLVFLPLPLLFTSQTIQERLRLFLLHDSIVRSERLIRTDVPIPTGFANHNTLDLLVYL